MLDLHSSEFSRLSDLSWFVGKGKEISFINYYDDTPEYWEEDIPTRTKIPPDIANRKHIVLVGDSFTYGHGNTRIQTISHEIQQLAGDEYFVVNLGIPGASNQRILTTLHQWINGPYKENLHAIICGFSFHDRGEYWYNDVYTHYGDSVVPLYNVSDWDLKPKLVSLSVQNPPDTKNYNKKIASLINDTHRRYYEFFATPTQGLISWEREFVDLTYIYNSLQVNVIWWEHGMDYLHNDDISYINQVSSQVQNTKPQTFKKINMHHEVTYKFEDYHHLPCGHWSHEGNKLVARAMYNSLKDNL